MAKAMLNPDRMLLPDEEDAPVEQSGPAEATAETGTKMSVPGPMAEAHALMHQPAEPDAAPVMSMMPASNMSSLSSIAAPEAVHQPSQMMGKERFHDTMRTFDTLTSSNRGDMLALSPQDPDYLKKLANLQTREGLIRAEKASYEGQHPLGSPESAHPGMGGKLLHILGKVGNIAGDAFIPNLMPAISGSEANIHAQRAGGMAEIEDASRMNLQAAQADSAGAKTKAEETYKDLVGGDGKPAVWTDGKHAFPIRIGDKTNKLVVITPQGAISMEDAQKMNVPPPPPASAGAVPTQVALPTPAPARTDGIEAPATSVRTPAGGYKVGDAVNIDGKTMYVTGFDSKGRPTLELEPPAGTAAKTAPSTTAAPATYGFNEPQVDENKQPIKQEGVDRHNLILETLTKGMSPDEKKNFTGAYSVKPEDTLAVQTKRAEDAKTVAALSGAERDRALARDIAARNHQDAMVNHADQVRISGQKQMFDYGINPANQERLSLTNAPDEMLVNLQDGKPVPFKSQATLKPSQTEINRSQFANSVLHILDTIEEAKKNGKLPNGPLRGLSAEKMAALGLGNKEAQEAINEMSLGQSAATGAHVGGRFTNEVLSKMQGVLNMRMDDGQLAGAIHSLRNVMQPYAKVGAKMSVAEYNSLTPEERDRLKTDREAVKSDNSSKTASKDKTSKAKYDDLPDAK